MYEGRGGEAADARGAQRSGCAAMRKARNTTRGAVMYEGRGGEARRTACEAQRSGLRGDVARRDEGAGIPLAERLCMKGGEGRRRTLAERNEAGCAAMRARGDEGAGIPLAGRLCMKGGKGGGGLLVKRNGAGTRR
ncbi:MAG: hypothetical protein LBP19_05145 [Treponema sp.]|jgi:hypothetical protein|nr:hypothetical protein [Treponema sp.]